MPKSNLDAIVGRALRDEAFRKDMLANPDGIASEYGLSADEVNQLKSISQEAADEFFNQVAAGATSMFCACVWPKCHQCYQCHN